jgi:hypothetical protein
MKKFSVLIVLALLAVAGTGYAVTCAYDNVPAATLLVPYFKVTLNGATDFPIPTGGTDTLVSVVNVSTPGVIAHVTVWNKYSKAVVDFNIPLTGKDVVSFSMRDILNGKLSPNLPQYNTTAYPVDPCGLVNPGATNAIYKPVVGWGATNFIRFSNPDAFAGPSITSDTYRSISQYNLTNPDAIGPLFRPTVWHSLDQSGDYNNWTTSAQTNVLDTDNPQCGWSAADAVYKDALSGYLTIDVVNYCTNFFPDQTDFYTKDAIATTGWNTQGYTYTPNCLIGDVFYVDSAANGGNISGDPAVAVEFDWDLPFTGTAANPTTATFFGKFVANKTFGSGPGQCNAETTNVPQGCTNYINGYAPQFQFAGDGREPLGDRYGFRYLADPGNGLQSWIQVWRSDYYDNATDVNLCVWADPTAKTGNAGKPGEGFYDALHQVQVATYDNDENVYQGQGIPPGPSGPGLTPPTNNYIFLESQRIALAGGLQYGWNPQAFVGGWVDLTLRSATMTRINAANGLYNMGWVGVMHTAPGAFISVGHATANLNNQNNCLPSNLFFPGNRN